MQASVSSIVPGRRDLSRRAVVQPRVRPVVVVLDVAADHLPSLVEGLELFAPDAALLELAEPGLDEGLALGVSVAAAAVCDPQPGEDDLERASGERGAVVGAERERRWRDAALDRGPFDQADGFLGAAAGLQMPGDDLARAAVDRGHQVNPAVLGHPDAGHIQMPELIGALDAKESRPTATRQRPATLDEPTLAHHRAAPACG